MAALKMRLSPMVLIGLFAISLVVSIAQSSSLEVEQGSMEPIKKVKLGINFKQFKEMFHKKYNSLVEETMRQKIFLGNLIKSFLSKIRYNSKKADFFLAMNDMSDWSVPEWESTLIKPEVLGLKKDNDDDGSSGGGGVGGFFNWKLLKNAVDGATRFVNNKLVDVTTSRPEYRPDLPDEVFIDHRKTSHCLNVVKRQYRCGSCYIFSTTALYEWAYCRAMGQKIKFSEQYVIDCGRPDYLRGCRGGVEEQVASFVKDSGLDTMDIYWYEGKEKDCPYGADHKLQNQTWQFKLDKPELKHVAFNDIGKQLEISPVVMTIYVGPSFFQYGGGVDPAVDCQHEGGGLHSVLLVGHGRENGHEYWIIRNSYGFAWGEMGHYRLRKDSRCYRFMDYAQTLDVLHFGNLGERKSRLASLNLDDKFKLYEFHKNPKYDKELSKQLVYEASIALKAKEKPEEIPRTTAVDLGPADRLEMMNLL